MGEFKYYSYGNVVIRVAADANYKDVVHTMRRAYNGDSFHPVTIMIEDINISTQKEYDAYVLPKEPVMTIEKFRQQYPDLYIRVLNEGAGYGVQGFSHFDSMADVTDADIQLQLMYDDMMRDAAEQQNDHDES